MTVLLFAVLFTACNEVNFTSQRNLDFNQDWLFLEDSIIGAQATDFNDQRWLSVDLPHDWSMTDYKVRDSVHVGPFYKDIPLGHDVGYLRGGTGWYRKAFVVDKVHEGKEVILHFDGVMSEMTLWVNGQKVGEHVYGYTPFYFNITDFLNAPGENNIIAIQVYKPTENSRWFTGAGIYRSVEISYLNPVHVNVWGIGITSEISGDQANIKLDLEIENSDFKDGTVVVHGEILSPNGDVQLLDDVTVSIPSKERKDLSLSDDIINPVLWDVDNPVLYQLRIQLFDADQQVDEYIQEFGIRTIEYSAENGFLLNGKNILLKGACMHHDNGLLGAAAFQAAEERRVQIMKDNGYNAIRTSHNPPSKYFLDACDKLGMLVIDEAFDMWIQPKRKNDYHQYFENWWKTDLESMIMRDRNHPSIIMWSFGNEVKERADDSGVAIGKNCIDVIRSIDKTRPITQAVCGFWDNPGKEWDDSAPAFEIVDIAGYNYKWDQYKSDHEKHPKRIMFGSESVPNEAFENWQLVQALPYVIGDFVWTGMDYIGESGIGHSIYPNPGDDRTFIMPWPTYISWCGDIDIVGNKKPQSYYRDVIWDESNIEILVHEPALSGNKEVTSFWGWPNEVPSWNWEGFEGELLDVNVYSKFSLVRLELNGEVVGEKEVSEANKFTASFKVPYTPGELKAIGVENGEVKAEKIIQSSSRLSAVELIQESDQITADRNAIVFIQVEGVDAVGILVNNSMEELKVTVQGPGALIAAGNANPKLEGSITDEAFKLFRGKALIIVRSTGETGEIQVQVGGPDLNPEQITILAE